MARTLTVLLGAALATFALQSEAKPVAQANIRHIVVTLTDEPCQFQSVIQMEYRGTWKDGDKSFEGCWGVNGAGIIVMYFDDKSFAAMPLSVFKPLTQS